MAADLSDAQRAVEPAFRTFPAPLLAAQIDAVLRAWGLAPAVIRPTVDGLQYADLRGIDSHGIAMLPVYERFRNEARFNASPQPKVLRDMACSALIDGDSALGFLPATLAMRLAIDKARANGIGMVGVCRSNHFGAAGQYAMMAADAGLVGIATSNVYTASVVPTGGRAAMLGTNPFAFAAPAGRNRPFLLDMATSTVALGKLMTARLRGEPIPEGWALGPDGQPTTDPALGYASRLATPLGGTAILSSHKGYGLGVMVEILSATLTGAAFAPLRAEREPGETLGNVGHFLLAIDPGVMRDPGLFRGDLDDMMDALRATPPVDPAKPVQVGGIL